MRQTRISIVIPIYNEQENLRELVDRLKKTLDAAENLDWQVVFINDGSRDRSVPMILEMRQAEPRLTLVDLSRNFGHQAALTAGLCHADGDVVVMMDADLQDPPELIPGFLEKWREGYEVVYAVRRRRQAAVLKKIAYSTFYRLNRMIAKIDLPLDSGDFCLMDRCVVDALCALPEYNRFLRGLRSWVGFRQTSYEYDRPDRFAGTTKYSLWKLIDLALSGFLGFSTVPLRLAIWLGLASGAVGFVLMIWAVGTRLLGVPSPAGWASTIAVILFLGGVQLLVFGVLGEYLGNVQDEVRRRPVFIVHQRHGAALRQGGAPVPVEDRS
jgi:glycosyltransferase involved in cell wall biosynthesis